MDTELFMACEEDELKPCQLVDTDVEEDDMDFTDLNDPCKTEPTTVLPDPACGETPIKEEEMSFVVKEEEEEKRVFKEEEGEEAIGDSVLHTPVTVSVGLNTLAPVSLPPVSLPTGASLAPPGISQGQKLILTQTPAGLGTILLQNVNSGTHPPINQPFFLTTQGFPEQNVRLAQSSINPMRFVLNVQQSPTFQPITLLSGPAGGQLFSPVSGLPQPQSQPPQVMTQLQSPQARAPSLMQPNTTLTTFLISPPGLASGTTLTTTTTDTRPTAAPSGGTPSLTSQTQTGPAGGQLFSPVSGLPQPQSQPPQVMTQLQSPQARAPSLMQPNTTLTTFLISPSGLASGTTLTTTTTDTRPTAAPSGGTPSLTSQTQTGSPGGQLFSPVSGLPQPRSQPPQVLTQLQSPQARAPSLVQPNTTLTTIKIPATLTFRTSQPGLASGTTLTTTTTDTRPTAAPSDDNPSLTSQTKTERSPDKFRVEETVDGTTPEDLHRISLKQKMKKKKKKKKCSVHVSGILTREIISRLITKLESALSRPTLDLDFLEFTCRQELYLWEALERHVNVPPETVQALREFLRMVMDHAEHAEGTSNTVEPGAGEMEHPRNNVEPGAGEMEHPRNNVEPGAGEMEHPRNNVEPGAGEMEHPRNNVEPGDGEMEHPLNNIEPEAGEMEHPRNNVEPEAGEMEHPRNNVEPGAGEMEHPRNNVEPGAGEIEHPRNNIEPGAGEMEHPRNNVEPGFGEMEHPRNNVEPGAGEMEHPRNNVEPGFGEMEHPRNNVEPGAGEMEHPRNNVEPGAGEMEHPRNNVEPGTGEMEHPRNNIEPGAGEIGRPRHIIEKERLEEFLEMDLSVGCMSKLLCVSKSTVNRRKREFGLSASQRYSNANDQELDDAVRHIKNEMPTAGYRMVKGRLMSMGMRLQWNRLIASMHRVDSLGILSRLTRLGCIVRRTYSVRGPLSLWHVGTHLKLIRYNIVLFGAVDGYSRKVMCLDAATNNRASTTFAAFKKATERHGIPSRVRGAQGVENVEIGRYMCAVRGADRGSFLSGKSVHNQRIEGLWRDVRTCVTSKYYNELHSLEMDHLLDVSSREDLFSVHMTFLPKLKADLEAFVDGWNNHPLRTEENQTPEQLWQSGMKLPQIHQPENLEDIQEPDIDWDVAAGYGEDVDAVTTVPELDCPLDEQKLAELQLLLDQSDRDTDSRTLYLLCREVVPALSGV